MNKNILFLAIAAVTLTACTQVMPEKTSEKQETNTTVTQTTQQPTQKMDNTADKKAEMPKTIVEIAVGNPDFSTLVTAVKAAGLDTTLSSEGPFTVFAPTNAAFAKLPKATLDAVLADKQKLTQILTYHVVPGKVMAADVVKLTKATTVEGSDLKIHSANGVTVNNAKVVATDIQASNGVIHVIDTVLIPE